MYSLYTTCVDAGTVGEYGEDINEMRDSVHATDIEVSNFMKLADKKGFKEKILRDFNMNTHEFENDFGISCHSSLFRGHECLFVCYSGIEHVYIPDDQFYNMGDPDEAASRREAIEELDSQFDYIGLRACKDDVRAIYNLMDSFVNINKDTFEKRSILLSSLFTENEYASIVKKIDNDEFLNTSENNELSFK